MPIAGEKTPDYPFGYGFCQCGCGKTTVAIGDIHLKYFRSFHNSKVRENFLARQRAKQAKLAKQAELVRQGQAFEKSRGKELFEDPEMPPINQPATDAVAKEKQNDRLSHAMAWTKVNQDFIKWHRKKLRARTNETTKRYHRERRKRDPIFKLLAYVRGRIRGALSRKNLRKSTKTEQLLGCSVQELKNHLQAQFKAGMSWDNYGDWHVDHIRPCCNFDLTKIEQQKICFHYINLQPLWAEENFKKSGRYEPQSENAS